MQGFHRRAVAVVALATLLAGQAGAGAAAAAPPERERRRTVTPIEHVIIIIGENRTFDNVYGTYAPKHGQHVANLLSRGIVRADGTPGPNADLARQFRLANLSPLSYFVSTRALTAP